MTTDKTLTTEQKTLLKDIYNNIGIDLEWLMLNSKPETMEELKEEIDTHINYQIEVIYYDNAMDYLQEHDVSLIESLALAHDYGFTADRINSEVLATLHKQDQAREEIQDYYEELEQLFY